ncbi:hypothetical protein SAY87_029496 [Trapa incisa]|uniref:FLZ-type domain-containing protein n=1 Tax=Trapa incisa TaxID=236973 RepID=A0AAN7Q8W6_9MYRT|nr:hypothetical protein SAY87_029496 [Trapa incisa]
MEIRSSRRPYFAEEDIGLASLADMEVGFSGSINSPIFSRSICSPVISPFCPRFYNPRFEDQHFHQLHFLESCFLCKKPLGNNQDIFMYRGDTAFCSEECRQEQIDMDEAKEKKISLSSSLKAMRKKDKGKSSSPTESRGYAVHRSTVAAAS